MTPPRDPSREQELPESVSNQNGEEAEPGHDGQAEVRRSPDDSADGGRVGARERDDAAGASGEGSQSTGDPRGAG